MPRPERVRLGDLLVQQALISADQLTEALASQRTSGRKLGRVIIDSGWVTEEQIAQALGKQLRIPFIDLARRTVRPEIARLLPEVQARRLRALPLQESGGVVMVGMADPSDINAYDEVSRLLKREFDLVVVAETPLLAAMDSAYQGAGEIAGLAKQLGTELASVEVDLGDLLGLNAAAAEDAPVVRLLLTMFEEALRVRASDIHIEPQEKHLRIRYRIDGVLHVQTEADPKIASAVALRLKLMSGLDISERRLPQDGRFAVKLKSGAVDVRLSTMPTQYGESVVMRLLNQSSGLLSLPALNLPPHVAEAIHRAIHKPSGMVLVTGPTGSGKTTTLYAALNELNSTGRKIITVEDPVEYRLPGINQVQVMEKIDLSFGRVLRAALRQDPDIILVGEMRDLETAEIGLRAAMTGHMVLSTLHTNDAASTPVRLIDMGVPHFMVATSLQLVLAQRLVRMLCQSCAQPYQPDEHEAAWLRALSGRMDPDLSGLRHSPGCAKCNHTGTSGRTGVYEYLEMDRDMIQAVNQEDPNRVADVARQQMQGRTLAKEALALALAGQTTVADAMSVSSQLD
ncbi:GspE/PulE family protein [Pelomonas sp. SE-A7]|uniref:GspE/PulE family protein n=1 Tax=Pelomonas sp. SE-A7 TaxID=3054953 RepID=UPI00259C92D6|nr:GspE/PulE family protein [Pelomonas sp. SE-A7]MDM4767784.1 GspE/PulE family protein [Pelomonas sp. SE-A7]